MIETIEQLREIYPQAVGRAVQKELALLEQHSRRFIQLSPMLIISSSSPDGQQDASPRGGEPGFVTIVDNSTLLIPDSAGNNRLDTLENIVQTGRIGLLFLVPGVDETLRINGRASIRVDSQTTELFPRCRSVVRVDIEAVYLHCAKSLMRAKLWSNEARQAREVLPAMGKMINDQIGQSGAFEPQDEMVARYARDL